MSYSSEMREEGRLGVTGFNCAQSGGGGAHRGEKNRMRATNAVEGSAHAEICSCRDSALYIQIAGNAHVVCAMNARGAISVVLWCCVFIDIVTVTC